MKKAAKILCIIALIFGLIWATVGFFGSWVGGAVIATGEEVFANDSASANETFETSANIMLRLLGSFVVVILGGVLGIVGASKEPSKLKPIVLGFLTFICGFLLFPLSNYVAAAIYLVAGLLLLIAGLTTKQQVEIKQLIFALIGMGVVLAITMGGYFILKDGPEKTNETLIEVIESDEQIALSENTNEQQPISEENKIKEIRSNFQRINSIKNWADIHKVELFESSEGGEAVYYSVNGELEKIIETHYGEMGKSISEYYLMNGQLSFVFEKVYTYNRPIYWGEEEMEEFGDTEIFDFDKSEITENRYYFDRENLFHIISTEKSSFSDSDLKKEGERLQGGYRELLTLKKE